MCDINALGKRTHKSARCLTHLTHRLVSKQVGTGVSLELHLPALRTVYIVPVATRNPRDFTLGLCTYYVGNI